MAKIALYTLVQAIDIIAGTGKWGNPPSVSKGSQRTTLGKAFRRLAAARKPAEIVISGVSGAPEITLRRHGKQRFKSTLSVETFGDRRHMIYAHSIVVDGVVYDDPIKNGADYFAPIYIDATDPVASSYTNTGGAATPASRPTTPPKQPEAAPVKTAPPKPGVDTVKPHAGHSPEADEIRVASALHDLVLNIVETERQARELAPPSITASLSDADAAWAAYREDHKALSELANEQLLALGRLIYANEGMVLVKSPHRPKDSK